MQEPITRTTNEYFWGPREALYYYPEKLWKSNECILEPLVTENGNLRFVAIY